VVSSTRSMARDRIVTVTGGLAEDGDRQQHTRMTTKPGTDSISTVRIRYSWQVSQRIWHLTDWPTILTGVGISADLPGSTCGVSGGHALPFALHRAFSAYT
jgi:hypothetical protein